MMAHRLMTYFTWTLLLLMILCPVQIYGVDSFCTADAISLGRLGRVICHFSENLSKVPQKDVNVYLYRVSDSDPELVVFYFWQSGKPHIKAEPGYNCTSNLTDHLEILIYNATRKHAGDYKCIVAPSTGPPIQKTCTLIIKEENLIDSNSSISSSDLEDQGIASFCTASSVSVGEKSIITFRFTEDLSIPPPKDLTVFLHKESATEPTLVLLYAWFNGSPHIDVTPGYICNGKLTDQLEIVVFNTTKEHAGLYRSVISHSTKHQTCMFHVKEERSADVTQNYTYIVPIVLGCLVLLVAIIIIIIMVFCWPPRWNNSSRTTESPSESEEGRAERESLQGNNGLGV